MFSKRQTTPSQTANVGMRMVSATTGEPITSQVVVQARAISRKGAILSMESPFIDGCHILMDVHNTTPKLVQVFLPAENPETQEPMQIEGRVESYQRVEDANGGCFVVELAWVSKEPGSALKGKDIKKLARMLKRSSLTEADLE